MTTQAQPFSRLAAFDKAAETITHDREKDYGDPVESFQRIADLWSVLLDTQVEPHQVALCMLALKMSRLCGSPDHLDTWVDIVGYARCGVMIGPKFDQKNDGTPF